MLLNRIVFWLLFSYVLVQLLSLVLGSVFLLSGYLLLYLIAIIYTVLKTSKIIIQAGNIRIIILPLVFFFIGNLILFLIYIPTLIYNPNINWKLKGGFEVDPMLYQAFVPPVFFCIALIVITFVALVTKLVSNNKVKMRTTPPIR